MKALNECAAGVLARIEVTDRAPPEERERLVGVGITEATEWIEDTEGHSVNSVTLSAFSDSKVRGFLGWLAGYAGLPVDDWVLKTNLRRCYNTCRRLEFLADEADFLDVVVFGPWAQRPGACRVPPASRVLSLPKGWDVRLAPKLKCTHCRFCLC